MAVCEEDVTVVSVVEGVRCAPAVSCDTGVSRGGSIEAGDVSIRNCGGGEIGKSIGSGFSFFGGGGGANIHAIVGEFAGNDQKTQCRGTFRVVDSSCSCGGGRSEVFASRSIVSECMTELFEVTGTIDTTCFFTGRVQSGKKHTSEDRDDSDDDEQLGKRKYNTPYS